MRQTERVEIIETLRGLAAFAVMWFHFTHVSKLFAGTEGVGEWIRETGAAGRFGVEVFFVISGFILPYSMHRSAYRLGDLFRFVAKRVIRLDPPYLANILLALLLWYIVSQSPAFLGERFRFEPLRFLCHLGYLNAIVGYGWYNPVYWTLAIEFQYYLLLAVVFPMLIHGSVTIRVGLPLVLALTAFPAAYPVRYGTLVFLWLGLFAIGMIAFQAYSRLIGRWQYATAAAAITAINCATLGYDRAALGLAVSLLLGFVRVPRIAPLAFLGTVSYSLYLIHLPLGARFINLGTRFASNLPERLVVLAVAIVVSVWSAYLCYRWFERPAQQWSSSIKYAARTEKGQARPGGVTR